MAYMQAPASVRLPLSGNVTQAINPWQWFLDLAGSRFSLISINLGRSPAPAVEHEVMEEVGSYGRQLGRIGDVLEVLLNHLDRTTLTEPETEAIAALETQLKQIRRIKRRHARADP